MTPTSPPRTKTTHVCLRCGHLVRVGGGQWAQSCPRCHAPTIDLGDGRRARRAGRIPESLRVAYAKGAWTPPPSSRCKWCKYRRPGG